MFKNWYIALITIIALVLLILFMTAKPEKVYVRDMQVDTVYKVIAHDPDTIVKKELRIVYIDTTFNDMPEIDTAYQDFKFVVNLFDKNNVNQSEMYAEDIQRRHIVTKPFEVNDTLITKKQDTVLTNFILTVTRPGHFNYYVNYSKDSVMTINKIIEVAPEKKWYESQWISGVGGALLVILILFAVE